MKKQKNTDQYLALPLSLMTPKYNKDLHYNLFSIEDTLEYKLFLAILSKSTMIYKNTNLENSEFFFIANDAFPEVLDFLKNKNIPHYIHNNTEEQKKERLTKNRETQSKRQADIRANETEEQKKKRLQKHKERSAAQRAKKKADETEEEKKN